MCIDCRIKEAFKDTNKVKAVINLLMTEPEKDAMGLMLRAGATLSMPDDFDDVLALACKDEQIIARFTPNLKQNVAHYLMQCSKHSLLFEQKEGFPTIKTRLARLGVNDLPLDFWAKAFPHLKVLNHHSNRNPYNQSCRYGINRSANALHIEWGLTGLYF